MINNMINEIYNETIRNVTTEIIDTYGNAEKSEYANKVAYWCKKLLEKRGILNENIQQAFVDIIYAAALIHNIFIDTISDDKYYEVLNARRFFTPVFKEAGLPEEYIQSIFQLIECQFGEASPISSFRPNPDTPQSTMAEAKFIVDTIISEQINYAV